jgi:Fe2+ transport system protein B
MSLTLEGLFFYKMNHYDIALEAYTRSLCVNKENLNWLRLQALKKIMRILKEKRKKQHIRRAQTLKSKFLLSQNKSMQLDSELMQQLRDSAKDNDDTDQFIISEIHKHLSKHYIRQRSVIFIIDRMFSSIFYFREAMNVVQTVFD